MCENSILITSAIGKLQHFDIGIVALKLAFPNTGLQAIRPVFVDSVRYRDQSDIGIMKVWGFLPEIITPNQA